MVMWEKVSAFKWVLKMVGYICLLSVTQLVQLENTIIFLVCGEIKLFCKDLNRKNVFVQI